MQIFIPSANRAQQFRSPFCTIAQMSKELRGRVTYVVPPADTDLYRMDAPPHIGKIVECPIINDIALKRRWIAENLVTDKKFVMLDDDLKWSRRRVFSATNLAQADQKDLDDLFSFLETQLDTYVHVGVSAREGNNRFGSECRPTSGVENTRMMRVLGYSTDEYLACEHGRVKVMEDFDITLQLLSRGYPNWISTFYAQDQPGTQNKGGCSDWRTKELHEAAADKMADLWPGIVTTRWKENKTGGDFGRRKEVTIQWKKAFKS
jgi:hypothetical protein